MMIKSTLIASLVASAIADTPVTPKDGKKVLSEARKLNQYYEEDYTWLTDYTLKFEGCSTIHSYSAEVQNDEEGNTTPAGFGTSQIAKFKLCSSSHSCSACANPGVYMVPLTDFAEYYLAIKYTTEQNACAEVEENCNCQGYYADDNACLNSCYKNAGLDFCNNGDFDPTAYVECTEYAFEYYYGNQQFFIGPVCSSDGEGVHLAIFTDMYCSQKAPSDTFETYSYGRTLPYSSGKELISSECVSCLYQDEGNQYNNRYYNNYNNNNNNRYYQQQATDTCTALYEISEKCETKMTGKNKYTRKTNSCTYIDNIIPALERVFNEGGIYSAAPAFAAFFCLTTLGAFGGALFFYMKSIRSTVKLSSKEGGNYA